MTSIERIEAGAKQEFYRDFYQKERPVILTGAIENWPARRSWSFDHMISRIGDKEVVVTWLGDQECHSGESFFRERKRCPMPFSEFMRRIRAGERYYLDQVALDVISPELARDLGPLPYYPPLRGKLSLLPTVIWIGPGSTVSPAHFDPPHNLFVQLVGRKRFTVFPASQFENLYLPSELPSRNISRVDIVKPDYDRFPLFRGATPFEGTVGPGEVLFLPRRWVHYLRALDDSISLSYWWHPWQDLPKAYWLLLRLHGRNFARKVRSRLHHNGGAADSPAA